MEPCLWPWQFKRGDEWVDFEQKVAANLSLAFASKPETPIEFDSQIYHLSSNSSPSTLICVSDSRVVPILVRHIMPAQCTLPPSSTPSSPLDPAAHGELVPKEPNPSEPSDPVLLKQASSQNSWSLSHNIISRHPSHNDPKTTIKKIQSVIETTTLPPASIGAWLSYMNDPHAPQLTSTFEMCQSIPHIAYLASEMGLETEFLEYLFGTLMLPYITPQEACSLLLEVWLDNRVIWAEDASLVQYTAKFVRERARDAFELALSRLPPTTRISALKRMVLGDEPLKAPPAQRPGPAHTPRFIETSSVQLPPSRSSTRTSPRDRIKSVEDGEFPLPPERNGSEVLHHIANSDMSASHIPHAQLIEDILKSPSSAQEDRSPRLEDAILFEKLADSLLAGTSLLNTSASQRLRNGQLQYILNALDKSASDLVSVIDKASSKSGALAALSHSVIIPSDPDTSESPHLYQLWETTVTLSSSVDEMIEWEILSPTRADGTSFFTCAHKLSDSQTASDEPSDGGWIPSRDPYIFSGTLLPNQQLPLLLSYVPLHAPKRGSSHHSFTHLVCIRLSTIGGESKRTSFAFIALRAKPSVPAPIGPSYWSVPRNEVYRGHKLGQGSFGSVYRATIRGLQCSLKYWPQITFDFSIELRALSLFRHEHLIPFIGAYDSSDSSQQSTHNGEGFVILKYATEGNLHQYYTRPGFSEANAFHFAYEIALGLQYLHSKDCIHRDIKSLNVLVDNGSACLIDFGSVRKSEDAKKSTTQTGSLPWVAPEVMATTPTYSKATDIFSFGLVLYELASKTAPPVRAREHVLKGAVPLIPETFAKRFPGYQDLYRLCTQREPDNRASINVVVEKLALLTQTYPVDDTKPLPEGSLARLESSVFGSLLDIKPPPP